MRLHVITTATLFAPRAPVHLARCIVAGWLVALESFLAIATPLALGVAGAAWYMPCHLPGAAFRWRAGMLRTPMRQRRP